MGVLRYDKCRRQRASGVRRTGLRRKPSSQVEGVSTAMATRCRLRNGLEHRRLDAGPALWLLLLAVLYDSGLSNLRRVRRLGVVVSDPCLRDASPLLDGIPLLAEPRPGRAHVWASGPGRRRLLALPSSSSTCSRTYGARASRSLAALPSDKSIS